MARNGVLIMDNGASTIKVGRSNDTEPRIVSNAVVRSKSDRLTFVGHEIENCQDFFGLHYRLPFEKGYLTDWDTEKAIWDKLFSSSGTNVDTRQLSLLVTEPYFNLSSIQETYDQLVFEEYEFDSYFRCTPASLIHHGTLFDEPGLPKPECTLIVDSGFSFTHVIPLIKGEIIWAGVRRIDVGGKLLTNHLKELVSFRHWDMMDQTYIMNDVKEKCCYVSTAFKQDLETCYARPKKNPIVQEYILPDYTSKRGGHIRLPNDDPEASRDLPILSMGNERFSVPEVLFNPSDIGLNQAGLAETIANSISSLQEDLQGMFWGNIGLIGGNVLFPGFEHRLLAELQPLAPAGYEVSLYKEQNPVTQAYQAARIFANSAFYSQKTISRSEYLEGGSHACSRRFGGNWKPTSVEEKVREKERTATEQAEPELGRKASMVKGSRTRRKSTK
ncbi:hypothetical protein BOTBODRAFT_131733 [Botryobasidium botryosum FD-172 SS1]|uniref:Actin-like protein ARP6 n=1 Tax=Botryobasidium botryosum (strain FD-172 SS1) TaxID=930990 RepID=A0A067MU72_BOTB1|nr:hypothetical protein BOTBODRAFT_131733 [Botryobasidium botryosum FD-172 SS1]